MIPNFSTPSRVSAGLCTDSDRPDEAFFLFRRANARYPESGSAQRGLAYLLYRYGRLKEAKALLGSLDKTRWPELANIEHELKARAIKGLPALRLPAEKDEPREKGEEKSGESSAEPASSGSNESEPQRKARSKPQAPKAAPETAKLPLPPLEPPAPPPPVRKPSLEGMVNVPGGRFMMGMEFARSKRGRRRWRRRRAPLRADGRAARRGRIFSSRQVRGDERALRGFRAGDKSPRSPVLA